jgi:hypothetical protein
MFATPGKYGLIFSAIDGRGGKGVATAVLDVE